ncbi:glycosyltransferase family 2 protein [Ruminococcaceae bacterium OttesenSCG-928-A16]|nr:glycosyltransferase family 2 protein [Ruminococcaceae bacterium OttesenSCG-928-A16]
MRVLVVIPAYNEEESLPAVIQNLQMVCPEYDYVVVNDGSKDSTAVLCAQNGYNVINLPINLGLAGAFQAGIRYAQNHGYDAAIQFDADGQHLPQYIKPLVQKLAEGNDIAIGSRFVTVKKPKSLRMLGSYIISFAMRFTTGKKICDPTSGMRIFNRRMINEFADNLNYAPEPDTISYLLRNGATIAEIQVEMAERTAGASYFTMVRSMRYMAEMTISILLIQWFRKRELADKSHKNKGEK